MDKSESNKNDFFLRIQYAFPILYEKVCLYFINIYLLLLIFILYYFINILININIKNILIIFLIITY